MPQEIQKRSSLINKPPAKPKNDGFARPQPPQGEVLADDPKMREDIDAMVKSKEAEDMKEQQMLAPLVARILGNVEEAESARLTIESQWIKNLRSYRGEDSNGESGRSSNGGKAVFRESEVHKPYIRTTTVKTRAAFSQIMEALMQNSRFPLMIEPTPAVSGVPEFITDDPNQAQKGNEAEAPTGPEETQEDFGIGYEGDDRVLSDDGLSWKQDDKLYEALSEGRDKSGGSI